MLTWEVEPIKFLTKFECYPLMNSLIFIHQVGLLFAGAAAAASLKSCLTLCDPRDGSPPGSPVPEILQARTLEWVAISFSNAWKWKVKVKSLSRVQLLATPWTAVYQAPPSTGFARQEYWSAVPSPGNLALCFGSLCIFPHVNLLLPWCILTSVYTGAHNWLHKLVIHDCGLQVLNPTCIFVGRWKVKVKVAQSCDSLRLDGLYSPWNSPGQNAGVGSLSLLQGIFPTQGSNPGLPHCRWVLCQLSDKGSPVRRYGDIKKLCCFQLPRIPFAFFWIPSCSYIIIHSPNLFSYFFHIPCPSLQLWPCD